MNFLGIESCLSIRQADALTGGQMVLTDNRQAGFDSQEVQGFFHFANTF